MSTLTWADVVADPYLKHLPFKIELNKWGRIEMSPASGEHGRLQVIIGTELNQRPGAQVLVERGAREFGATTPYVWIVARDGEPRIIRA